jgi:hypothetical protein
MSRDGDFVAVWTSEQSSGTDTSWDSIQGQRFASDGTPAGAQFQVNTITSHPQHEPQVSSDADGNFLVVWRNHETNDATLTTLQGQRYAADGAPLGGQFQINTSTMSVQAPSVSMNGDGTVVVWRTGTEPGIRGRRYAADGTALGGDFPIEPDAGAAPSVSLSPDGHFIVAWSADGSSGSDSSSYSVQAQRYDDSRLFDVFLADALERRR